MRMILAAAAMAAAVCAAGAASATNFIGGFDVTPYTGSSNGLHILTNPDHTSATGLNFNLTAGGPSTTFNLFQIWTDEEEVNSDDDNHRDISVLFSFTAPSGHNGTVEGETWGVDGTINNGVVQWNGPIQINFGAAGIMTIALNNTTFNAYDPPGSSQNAYNNNDLGEGHGQITGTFSLAAAPGGAVPEPATWGMMIMGFGMAGATMRRRRTAVAAA